MIQLLCLALALYPAGAAEATPGEVRVESFSGWTDSLVMTGGDCKVVLAPAVGGRVVCFSLNGENVLYQDPESWAKTLARQPAGFPMGGSYGDLGPELRGIPEHNTLGLGSWRRETSRPGSVLLRSQPDPALGVELEKEVVIDPDTGELGLQQRIKNVSAADISYCLWDRTQCMGRGFALLPLSSRSRFKAGWSLARKDAAGKLSYDGDAPQDSRARVLDRVLVVEAGGAPLKVGADSDTEWVAYTVGRLLFIKYHPCVRGGAYTDGGNSAGFCCDEKRATLETLSPEVRLAPGQSHLFPEKWVLLDLARRVDTYAEARALVKLIPPSPFRK
jgi:hypothetical protein